MVAGQKLPDGSGHVLAGLLRVRGVANADQQVDFLRPHDALASFRPPRSCSAKGYLSQGPAAVHEERSLDDVSIAGCR